MDRQEALDLIKRYIKNKNLLKHMLALEAIMRALAQRFGQDEETWAMAGLLHDIDYELTQDEPLKHTVVGTEILAKEGISQEILDGIRAHNEAVVEERKSLMEKAMYAADPLTGLIVTAALIHPDKKLASINTQFALHRFGEKSFARGVNREIIRSCQEMGLSLEEFVEIGLKAMQGIARELGL